MTISIYHVTLRHNGTPSTLLQTVLVPNWVERVVLRRKRTKVNFIGHKEVWMQHPDGPVCPPRQSKKLHQVETYLIKLGKEKNQRILKFR